MKQFKVELLIKGNSFKKALNRFKDTELVYIEDLGDIVKKPEKIGFKKLDKKE